MKKRMLCSLMAIITVLVSLPASAFARDEMKNTDPDKYYVLLDVRNQFVTVYEKDDQGEYSKVVRRFLCTTGKTKPSGEGEENKATPTPAGQKSVLENLPPLGVSMRAIGRRLFAASISILSCLATGLSIP